MGAGVARGKIFSSADRPLTRTSVRHKSQARRGLKGGRGRDLSLPNHRPTLPPQNHHFPAPPTATH